MIQELKNGYLTQFVWIVMGGCIRDEGTDILLNVNNLFESFMRGMDGLMCFLHDWCRKS